MAQGLRLGKATDDNGFGMLRRFLQYKMETAGKYVITADRHYASSRICSICGCGNPKAKDLKVRKWRCQNCSAEHDRDINAAVSLRNEGLRIMKENRIPVI